MVATSAAAGSRGQGSQARPAETGPRLCPQRAYCACLGDQRERPSRIPMWAPVAAAGVAVEQVPQLEAAAVDPGHHRPDRRPMTPAISL